MVVEADRLGKSYDGRRVVDDLSFALPAGECLGLLGPNGAGKTTTIRMVTCLTPVDTGALRVTGLDMAPRHHRAIKSRLGIVQQEESLDPDLSVEKNLTVYASYFGIARADAVGRADELMAFAELTTQRRAPIRTLSGGMKRRLMLARALINAPDLLVLDEPTTGLDPQARRLVWERIRSLGRRGTTILLTTHYMDEAAQLCDRLIIIDAGRIVAEGTPAALVAAHVGREVLELHLDRPAAETAASRLTSGRWEHERIGRVLYVYLGDQAPSPGDLATLGRVRITRRPASLEDVFLRLTGHALRS